MKKDEIKDGTSWLVICAFITAIIALTVAVGTPVFVQWEHNQALQRQAELNHRAAAQGNTWPAFGCAGDHYRVTTYDGGWQTSIPVWAEDGPIKCGKNGYTVNGKPVTEDQVKNYVLETLRREAHRDQSS